MPDINNKYYRVYCIFFSFSDSKEKLVKKRNRFCNGDGVKTDVETGSGRGKRKKIHKKHSLHSSSESEELGEHNE